MTERSKQVTADEALEMMRKLAKTIKVGDQIELRSHEPFSLDDDNSIPPDQPRYRWELVEITAILPPAPSGDVAVEVRRPDGTTSVESLALPFRLRAS